MIRLIEALNFRCLRYIQQPLDRFHLLVGPNASGKTSFLDVPAFLGDVVSDGLESAMNKRTPNFTNLVFGGVGDRFELAIEAVVPEHLKQRTALGAEDFYCRYEVAFRADEALGPIIDAESLRFRHFTADRMEHAQRQLFPLCRQNIPETLRVPSRKGERRLVSKSAAGSTNFYSEVDQQAGKGWVVNLRLSGQKSALGNLPEDEEKFPVSTWFKQMLIGWIQSLALDSATLRKASPPNQPKRFKPDASNLPWVVREFREKAPGRFHEWVAHLREALPDLADVTVVEQNWDRYAYLRIEYADGLKIPSWMASDGTLRLMALTLPAFLPDLTGTILIEEPENGVHPKAIETLYQALSCVDQAQVLLATHSPVLLGLVEPSQILCFAKSEDGATDIVRGDEHPLLSDWQRDVSLQDYFVAGVLG